MCTDYVLEWGFHLFVCRYLYVACHLTRIIYWGDLRLLISQLSSLTTVTFDLPIPPPSAIISALLSIPTLSSLELTSMPLTVDPPSLPRSSSLATLQRLILTRPVPWTSIDHCSPVLDPTLYLPRYHHRPANYKAKLRVSELADDECVAEEFVRSLLCATLQTMSLSMKSLKHLEIDLELVTFEALGRQEFPRMERLVFHGMCPLRSIGLQATRLEENPYDITDLKSMHNLRELRFALIHLRSPSDISKDDVRLPAPSTSFSFQVVHPVALPVSTHSLHPHPASEETIARVRDELFALFPNLEVFALSNPDPNDLIFHTLPPSVHSIHLSSIRFAFSSPLTPSHPLFRRVGPVTGGSRDSTVPRIDDKGLRKIITALRSHPGRRLYDFRAMLSDKMTPELLECVAEAFPELRRLEVKRSFEDAPVRYGTRQIRGQIELDAFAEMGTVSSISVVFSRSSRACEYDADDPFHIFY